MNRKLRNTLIAAMVAVIGLIISSVLHELLQGYRINCLLQLMDFSASFFGIVANVRGKAHRRCSFYSIDWKERQPRYIKYFSGKITIELLKRLTSQAGFAAVAFCSA